VSGSGPQPPPNPGPEAPASTSKTELNKALVLRFILAGHRGDIDAVNECIADDVTRFYPRPTCPYGSVVHGREALLGAFHAAELYRMETIQTEVEHMVAEGDFVAIQFVLRATTRRGKDYENFYHHLFECENGRIKNQWEYVDTHYAQKLLFDDRE
jgi:ketosteroid isomerase-like protein